ncbi:hypothetical protein HETIRDRAFT_105471 [Heterobasidion irregulare TC 32-1]|uniref:BTB domain-containing protein n=1 Tax=Heterobasidion irregulare (strain TC 32-1) TaxID=747525 RepID=W4JWC9_HETIT|nr:uncharacterized protein HETIRDRAFT_105471 [Heterobasidion irregulare TC 32-1]ETW77390.1 hypothetical protein HETIRDRAFT_105471 [Heterobasidion irregulare TC 32-1]
MNIPSDTPGDSRAPKHHHGELEAEPLVNHPTRYYKDGNFIFQCGQTLFCVHRTVVTKVSTVFKEMLALDRIHETIRGCTLLKIDDNESDMVSFLNALYGERYIGLRMTSANFPLSSVLRLAHKYRVAHMKTEFIVALHAAWPSNLPQHLQFTHDLAACCALQSYIQDLPIDLSKVIDPEVDTNTTTNVPVHPAAVIALLRAINYDDQGLLMAPFTTSVAASFNSAAVYIPTILFPALRPPILSGS